MFAEVEEDLQTKFNGYTTSKVMTTVQGYVAEEAFYDVDGNLVRYWAYGYYDSALPFQGEQELKEELS